MGTGRKITLIIYAFYDVTEKLVFEFLPEILKGQGLL
jgi:hypothetical protein